MKKIEAQIAGLLKIPQFESGPKTIRDERAWRVNEIRADYCWCVKIDVLGGRGGIFGIKFESTDFRGIENSEAFTSGIFLTDPDDNITQFYIERNEDDFEDPVREKSQLNLFNAGDHLTLDGINYRFHINAHLLDVVINANNPLTEPWREWELAVHGIAHNLARKSENQELIDFF